MSVGEDDLVDKTCGGKSRESCPNVIGMVGDRRDGLPTGVAVGLAAGVVFLLPIGVLFGLATGDVSEL